MRSLDHSQASWRSLDILCLHLTNNDIIRHKALMITYLQTSTFSGQQILDICRHCLLVVWKFGSISSLQMHVSSTWTNLLPDASFCAMRLIKSNSQYLISGSPNIKSIILINVLVDYINVADCNVSFNLRDCQ
jgi:hypothetical protein